MFDPVEHKHYMEAERCALPKKKRKVHLLHYLLGNFNNDFSSEGHQVLSC